MKFTKDALSPQQHCELLKERGLLIENEDRACKYLSHIGYYRFTGYMYPFQLANGSHQFKEDVTFQTILDHYIFDKKLRFMILEVIERIEVSIRARISNEMSLGYGPHWYLDPNHFNNLLLHNDLRAEVEKICNNSNEQFIKSYMAKYTDPELPPGWMILETLTFGQMTSLFENLKDSDQKKEISRKYDIVVPLFESWLKSINFIRNCCAHHSRLWNRKLPLKPRIPTRKGKKFLNHVDQDTDKRLYGILSCMLHLLKAINPESKFKFRIRSLFVEYPMINTTHMGFPPEWYQEEIWQ